MISHLSRRGFALIAVLWLITVLAALVALSISGTRLGNRVSINRIALTRGRWAAEACGSIAQARWVEHRWPDTATIDLGEGVRCGWTATDPSTRINVNTAGAELLRGLGAGEKFVRGVIERRRRAPFESVGDVRDVSGVDTTLLGLLTVDGAGAVNLSTASRRVLGALPGLGPEAVDLLLYARSTGNPVRSVDQLAARLSPPARAALLARYGDLARIATFSPPQLVLELQGWVEGEPPRAKLELLVVPLPDRIAVVRRRMW